MQAPTKDEIEEVLDSRVRALLRADGGDVRVTRVGDDGTIHVRLVGRCAGCPGSTYTLSTLIEPVLLNELSGVRRVILVPWTVELEG